MRMKIKYFIFGRLILVLIVRSFHLQDSITNISKYNNLEEILKLNSLDYLLFFLTIVVTLGCSNESFGIELDAQIFPSDDRAIVSYDNNKTITLEYNKDYTLAQVLDGKNETISFSLDSSDATNGLSDMLSKINNLMSSQNQSLVKFDNATLDYKASIIGGPSNATIAFHLKLKPNISNLVTESNQTFSLLDIGWRNISFAEPLFIKTKEYGQIDINHPFSVLKKLYPTLVAKIEGTSLTEVVNAPLLNFDRFGIPVNEWQFSIKDNDSGSKLSTIGVTEIMKNSKDNTVYSFSDSSNSDEGIYTENLKYDIVDYFDVRAESYLPIPVGFMEVDGPSQIQNQGDTEYLAVPVEPNRDNRDLNSDLYVAILEYYPAVTAEFIGNSTIVLKGDEEFMLKTEYNLSPFWEAIETIKQFGYNLDEVTESGMGSVGNPTRFYAIMSLDTIIDNSTLNMNLSK